MLNLFIKTNTLFCKSFLGKARIDSLKKKHPLIIGASLKIIFLKAGKFLNSKSILSGCLNLSVLTLICFTFSPNTHSQGISESEEFYENAEYFFKREDFHEALFYYLQLHDINSSNDNVNYHIGMCYLNMPGEEEKAIPYLEQAVKNISSSYKKNTLTETHAPLHSLYYLGNAYRMNNQLTEALELYNQFINHPDLEKKYNLSIVENDIKASQQAKVIRDKPIMIQKTNLGSLINNEESNYNAVVSSDENMIIFMTHLKFYEGIFMSFKVNGIWSDPENITSQLRSDGDFKPTCLSSDGKTLFLVKTIRRGNNDIYQSFYNGATWSLVQPLNNNINTRSNETHASISADGQKLYFTSDRSGGYGNLDIYVSKKTKDGDWGPAENLGPEINTEFNEETPHISEDGNILFFSSEGHLNMGGYDIFYSRKIDAEKWDNPVNIGFPINTTRNDLFYYPIRNGNISYYSMISKDGYGKEDIYRIENLSFEQQEEKIKLNEYNLRTFIIIDKTTSDTIAIYQYNKSYNTFDFIRKPKNFEIIMK